MQRMDAVLRAAAQRRPGGHRERFYRQAAASPGLVPGAAKFPLQSRARNELRLTAAVAPLEV